jgi:L-alanine-DL-glutamate epimerase-like enolase superfamily enzyme
MTQFAVSPQTTEIYFLPVETRVPFKFGHEVLTEVTCARIKMQVTDRDGKPHVGWGETPLNVQWAWPSSLSYAHRHNAMLEFCRQLGQAWSDVTTEGHALEIGHHFVKSTLPSLLAEFNRQRQQDASASEPMPHLAALVCCSAFDLALHDAYGKAVELPTFQTFTPEFLQDDLSAFLEPASDSSVTFDGLFPKDFLVEPKPSLVACHLVGGKDPLDDSELTGDEPDDGYPVTLEQWIDRDGLSFLKVKLCGNDADWDLARIVRVGQIACERGVSWLTYDFNCTVTDPAYVNQILDHLRDQHPRFYQMILYVEQPFPYDLEKNRIDVHSVSARKPLFMDESAHDWQMIRKGRQLGWNGVALKTCKTLTGAILSLCWAKAHGMALMVQDLTNPMLAQIPHVQLAGHADTIMGVETNGMQFYPAASEPESVVHPGLYQRRSGQLDLTSIQGNGLGYREEEIQRTLPPSDCVFGQA